MYIFEYDKEKYMVKVKDNKGSELAIAVFSPFLDSDISVPRLNIFIDIDYCVEENADDIKSILIKELIRLGREVKKEYGGINTRIYNCVFADARDKIDYFSSIEGFKRDEGMYILKKSLKERQPITDIMGVEFISITENTRDFSREMNR